MKSIIRVSQTVLNLLETVCLIAAVILTIICVGPKLFGMQTYYIKSGSMEPNIHTGSIVYIEKTEAESIQSGDIIFFTAADQKVVHRVDKILDSEKAFVTKGDNNESVDVSPVPFKNVTGKVIFTIPLVGYIAVYVMKYKILLCIIAFDIWFLDFVLKKLSKRLNPVSADK